MEEQTPENSTALTEDCGGNPCSTTLKNLYEYLDGALTAEEIQEIQRHLDACSHCAEAKDLEVLLRAKIKSRVTSRRLNPSKPGFWNILMNFVRRVPKPSPPLV